MQAIPVYTAPMEARASSVVLSTFSPSPSPSCYTVTQYLHDNIRNFLVLEYRVIPSHATYKRLRTLNEKVLDDLIPTLPASRCLSNNDRNDFEKIATSAVEFTQQIEDLAYQRIHSNSSI